MANANRGDKQCLAKIKKALELMKADIRCEEMLEFIKNTPASEFLNQPLPPADEMVDLLRKYENDIKQHINSTILQRPNIGVFMQNEKSLKTIIVSLIVFFSQHNLNNVKILELGSGHGDIAKLMMTQIKNIEKIICTDIQKTDAEFSSNIVFDQLDYLSAVKKYWNEADILLLINPTPFDQEDLLAFGDLFAIDEFIKQTKLLEKVSSKETKLLEKVSSKETKLLEKVSSKKTKYIILAGEIGASDGTTGLDTYLNNANLTLVSKRVYYEEAEYNMEKILYIYKI
jgi:SAM-dependent MidA family methyltransferase